MPPTSESVPELAPGLLALDFDGVICDGLPEYFHSAWVTHQYLWPGGSGQGDRPPQPTDSLERAFGRLRPVVETGWEMPLVIEALLQGIPEADLLADWIPQRDRLVQTLGLDPRSVGETLDGLRDEQIRTQPQAWLALHRFYPGVVAQLQAWQNQGLPLAIITTKEGRFVKELLASAGLQWPDDRLWGKETQTPKAQVLEQLSQDLHQGATGAELWFIEDRLPTLQKVLQHHQTQPYPVALGLFLADWGYNTPRDRSQVRPPLHLLSLEQFSQGFGAWGRALSRKP